MVVFGGEYADGASGDAPSGCENEDNMAQLYVESDGNQATGTQGNSLATQTASWRSGSVVTLDDVQQDNSNSSGSSSQGSSSSKDSSEDKASSTSGENGEEGDASADDTDDDDQRDDDDELDLKTQSSGGYTTYCDRKWSEAQT